MLSSETHLGNPLDTIMGGERQQCRPLVFNVRRELESWSFVDAVAFDPLS
jgi:hypothetical protein